MAYESGMLEMALAAAVGNDATLVLELRTAFLESAEAQLAGLTDARSALDWQLHALRLRGLAASFGADDLLVAVDALSAAPAGDAAALGRVRDEIAAIAG